jgi:predicted RND superfamily exporter protein
MSDLIISLSAGAIAILISITAYFAQKWIDRVDETFKEHSSHIKDVSTQISLFEQKQSAQAENISKTIQSQLSTVQFPHKKIDELKEEIVEVRKVVQQKILPHVERANENFGRVIILEESMKEQNTKLITMFNAVKVLLAKQSPK